MVALVQLPILIVDGLPPEGFHLGVGVVLRIGQWILTRRVHLRHLLHNNRFHPLVQLPFVVLGRQLRLRAFAVFVYQVWRWPQVLRRCFDLVLRG